MDTVSTLDPSRRQVLVNLGNRYVVFGPSSGLPQVLRFDAKTDSQVLPRVADEDEVAEARIVQTLRVPGMTRPAAGEGIPDADIELIDDDGARILVDIKVRESDPKARDLDRVRERLTESASAGQTLEIWYFNIERLKLSIFRFDESGLRIDVLTPLDVWENTDEGVFNRARVVEEVEDWIRQVGALYDEVRAWLIDRSDLRCEQSRTVTMSELTMQQFAVGDREVPVLDVIHADNVIATFVPRGRWTGASMGRIDVITSERTQMLLRIKPRGAESLEWRLVPLDDREVSIPFDRNALLVLISEP